MCLLGICHVCVNTFFFISVASNTDYETNIQFFLLTQFFTLTANPVGRKYKFYIYRFLFATMAISFLPTNRYFQLASKVSLTRIAERKVWSSNLTGRTVSLLYTPFH